MTSDPPQNDPPQSNPRQSEIPTLIVQTAAGDATALPPGHAERFPPGTLLGERYRIVGRLGRGGMGEVYRADDLKLGQSVALKFLPHAVASDPTWLRRLHHEVRIARDVAHPNVCRTYDIGEVDGEHFISMEYVDGEDLAILLRRIGRLPPDKAVEIARQLCAGLAAAHDKGVLHRDLKPANIMLDGRGHVRITDFGIAGLSEQIAPEEIRAGTPFYMAPEQFEGKSVSERSDIYSLGLILYEVYTGKAAYHADSIAQLRDVRRSGMLSTPSSIITDIDPVVERVIMRCLEDDPADRPGSAIAVAAALPGGDPLAMALAAGETPSPEMVAYAGDRGGLRPAVAIALGVALLVCILVGTLGRDRTGAHRYHDVTLPPAVLAHRAGEIARSLGYDDAPGETRGMFGSGGTATNWIQQNDAEADRWSRATESRVNLLRYSWRSAPSKMTPKNWKSVATWNDPPHMATGMIRMQLGPDGRLMTFDAVPGPSTSDELPITGEPDWAPMLSATGLTENELARTEPERTPPHAFDTRAAWEWTGPGHETYALRIEAAAWRGRVVWMTTRRPWHETSPTSTPAQSSNAIMQSVGVVFALFPIAGAVMLAGHNLRIGRSDRRGAFRLAMFFLLVSMGEWLFITDRWLSTTGFPLATWAVAFGRASGTAIMVWLFYLAVEPYARRHWPRTMVSWTRLLAGRWRDPMVGRDILIGCLAAGVTGVLAAVINQVYLSTGAPPPRPTFAGATAALGGRHAIATLFGSVTGSTLFIGYFVLLLLLRLILGRTWIAVGGALAILAAISVAMGLSNIDGGQQAVTMMTMLSVFTLVAVRYGLLAIASMGIGGGLLNMFPTTLDMSAWHASIGLVGPAALLALAGFGLWTALAGQPIFKTDG